MWDWALLNENKALWLRAPGEVDEEDYEKFYKALAKVRRHAFLARAWRPSCHRCRMHMPAVSSTARCQSSICLYCIKAPSMHYKTCWHRARQLAGSACISHKCTLRTVHSKLAVFETPATGAGHAGMTCKRKLPSPCCPGHPRAGGSPSASKVFPVKFLIELFWVFKG